MNTLIVRASPRTLVGKKVQQLRNNGQLPVVLYGQGVPTQSLTVDARSFAKIVKQAGTSTLVDVVVGDQPAAKILIHEEQYNPRTGDLVHADLLQVKMNEKLQTEVELVFVGESLAVSDLGGNLVTTKSAVEVEAYPQDLIPSIEVDISVLKTFDDKITVADLQVPSTISILDDAEETVAVVTAPRSDEELEAQLSTTTDEQEAAAVAATEEASATAKPEEEETE